MKTIILKMSYKSSYADIREDILKELTEEYKKTGILLLPNFVDFVTVVDDDDCELEIKKG